MQNHPIIHLYESILDIVPKVLNIHHEIKKNPKILVNWISSEFFGLLKKSNIEISDSPITPDNFGKLIRLILSEKISGKIAKEVFEEMFKTKKSPDTIIESKKLVQVSDEGEIMIIIDKILKENEEKVQEYRNGKIKLFGFFVGLIMKNTQGRANPNLVNKILKKKIDI